MSYQYQYIRRGLAASFVTNMPSQVTAQGVSSRRCSGSINWQSAVRTEVAAGCQTVSRRVCLTVWMFASTSQKFNRGSKPNIGRRWSGGASREAGWHQFILKFDLLTWPCEILWTELEAATWALKVAAGGGKFHPATLISAVGSSGLWLTLLGLHCAPPHKHYNHTGCW